MEKYAEYSTKLVSLSDTLDKVGHFECADLIDKLVTDESFIKTAQYVGAIGYVLKQHRAMSNCVRKKRASSDDSMQNVIMSCLKEYQDGQSYDNNEWTSKYAQVASLQQKISDDTPVDFLQVIGEENSILPCLTKTATYLQQIIDNGIVDPGIQEIYNDVRNAQQLVTGNLDGGTVKLPFV